MFGDASFHKERLLILVKTYPNPSATYTETVCVAALSQSGELRRLYPVPFRSLNKEQQFKKWQWIEANVKKASYSRSRDYRPESYRIDRDSITCHEIIGTDNHWAQRRFLVENLVIPSFCQLLSSYDKDKPGKYDKTLAIVKAIHPVFIIEDGEPEWTPEEKQKLDQDQAGLFDDKSIKNTLEKIPFTFRYSFCCQDPDCKGHNLMITDWEAAALYRNCKANYGNNWKDKVFEKYGESFVNKDLHLIVGNMQRLPENWLVVGVLPFPSAVARQPLLL